MNIHQTKTHLSFADAAKKDWYLTCTAQKPACKVKIELEDGKSALYRSVNAVKVGDVAVIGADCKTSFAMGKVVDNTNTSGGKSKLAPTAFVFTNKANDEVVKKSASKIVSLEGTLGLEKAFPLKSEAGDHNFTVVEKEIENVLFAANVLAHKNMATSAQIKKAITCLETPKAFPVDFFGNEMARYQEQWVFWEWAVVLSGFYEGWEDQVLSLPLWSNEGKKLTIERSETGNSIGVYTFDFSDALKKRVSKDAILNEVFNELVFRSALSILIRGGFVNMLEAALSVSLPIKSFYDQLIKLAKETGSTACCECLEKARTQICSSAESTSKNKSAKKDAVLSTYDKTKFLIEKNVLVSYKGDEDVVTIPDGVKTIGEKAFERKNLKKVIFSESVTQVKDYAFSECKNLEEVVFNKKIKKFYPFVFYRCTGLTKVDLTNTEVKTFQHNVFRDALNLKEVLLPNTVQSIATLVFSGTSISKITLPDSLEEIASDTFYRSDPKDVYIQKTSECDFRLSTTATIHCIKGSCIDIQLKKRISNGEKIHVEYI